MGRVAARPLTDQADIRALELDPRDRRLVPRTAGFVAGKESALQGDGL